MSEKPIRQFCEVIFKFGGKWTITGLTGKIVKIKARNLYENEKRILSKTCDIIESKLSGTSYEEPIRTLMEETGFLVTSSQHVGGYSVKKDNNTLVILNVKVFSETYDELEVTVLHELLHFVRVTIGKKYSTSLEEAQHDIICYNLLGIPVPLSHWAFIKYPQLKNEFMQIQSDPSKIAA